MPDLDLEFEIGNLGNVQATLAHTCYWSMSQMANDQPLGKNERDAMIGAVEAIGWAVERVEKAWQAEWDAKRAEARNDDAA